MKATINNIEKIVKENGLELIQTTSGMNGYPESLMYAVTGFDSFDQLTQFISRYKIDRSPEVFEQRDGWDLWSRNNHWAFEEFEFSPEDYGDNYATFEGEEAEFEPLKDRIRYCDTIEEVEKLVDRYKDLVDKFNEKKEDEAIVTNHGEYYQTVKTQSMSTYHDTRSHVIGVLIERDNRIDDLELNEGDTTFWYDEVTHQCVSLEITEGIYEEIINGEYMDFENIPDQVLDALTSEVKASGYSIDDYTGAVYIDNGNNEGHYYLVW